jgi:ribosomal protein S18 acetylase RimI-like enzyme
VTMQIRPYRGWDDLRAMQAVCSARLLASPGRAAAHPGDIAWWVGWPPRPVERLAEMFLLWEEGDEVVGFAALMHDEGELSVFVSPALTDTEAAVDFEGAAEAWASRGDTFVRWTEFEDETAAVTRWCDRGYLPTGVDTLNLTRALDDMTDDGAADDRIRAVGDDDVEGRASITHAAFGSPKPFADYAADYAVFRASPAYPHDWDLLLRDENGRAAACCIAWPDHVSRAGTFEPVATHPEFHRRGFGRALLQDGLHRFAAAGMTFAIVGVETDNLGAEALYRSVGFRPDRVLRAYARP